MAASMSTKIGPKHLCFTRRIARSVWSNSSVHVMQHCKASSKSPETPIDYCVNLVKKCDHESYLCTLLYPKEFRGSAFAIRALYTELALVQDVTSDHMRAMMRLQFWKDTIDQIYKHQPPQSPVALQVTMAVQKHKLSKSWFTRILEARAQQVTNDSYRTLKDVEDLGDKTSSSLYYLLLEAAGIKDVNADHACGHLGKCQSLVTLLRAMPFHAQRNKVYVPLELLIKHKVSQEQILRVARPVADSSTLNENESISDIVYEIACAAKEHLDTAQSLQKSAPKNTQIVMLNSVILNDFITNLEKANFDIFNPGLHVKDKRLGWKLFKKRYLSH